jgi:hypothetical protein
MFDDARPSWTSLFDADGTRMGDPNASSLLDEDGQPLEPWPGGNERPGTQVMSIFDADGSLIGFCTGKTEEGRLVEEANTSGGTKDTLGGEEDPSVRNIYICK